MKARLIKQTQKSIQSKAAFSAKARRRDPSDWCLRYSQALLLGDEITAGAVITEVIAARYPTRDVFSWVIAPALKQVGDSWCRGEISVGVEHLASQIVLKHLDQLRPPMAMAGHQFIYRVLVACVEGEEHFIGAKMFANLCVGRGWWVDFLGPNTPTTAVLNMVERRKPQLVALSATMSRGFVHVRQILRGLTKLSDVPVLIIGGQAFGGSEVFNTSNLRCAVGKDLAHGIDLASALLRRNHPKAALREYLVAMGKRVRALRNQKGWTQEQLAKASKVTRVYIVAVEGGKQNVSMEIVLRISHALETAPDRLLADGD